MNPLPAAGLFVLALAALAADSPAGPSDGPAVIRELDTNGFHVRLDLSKAVLGVDLPEDRELANRAGQVEAPLQATPRAAGGFVSGSVLGWKAKQLDDGLYAAVELAAGDGRGRLPGKRRLIEALARALSADAEPGALGNAPAVVYSAARLGGIEVDVPATFTIDVATAMGGFLGDPLRSKPIGFYTWSDPLEQVFRRDRMLQAELRGSGGILALTRALRSDASQRAAYEAHLRLAERLTNPGASLGDLRPAVAAIDDRGQVTGTVPDDGVAVFPASRSHETDLVMKLYGHRPIPEGFDLAAELIRAVRAGTVSLVPTAQSGWYDRQTWALEPLIRPEAMPEAARLRLSDSYRKQLEALFRGLLTLTRETHIKQLELPAPGAMAPPQIMIWPELAAEPLPTHFLRRAEAYAFVRTVLEEAVGPEALAGMHRETAAGPVAAGLADELAGMQALCFGAYALASRQLGLTPDADPKLGSGQGIEADIRAFRAWQAGLAADPDLGGDSRAMVPVFYDSRRQLTKAWVVLGWSSRPVRFDYATPPAVIDITRDGKPVDPKDVRVMFDDAYHAIAYPVTAEVSVSKVLDRGEFRALCDRHKTPSAILKALR